MPINPLDTQLKKIADLFKIVILHYYQFADNDRLRRLVINIVEASLIDLVNKLKRAIPNPPVGCPPGMVESGKNGCVPR